VFIKRENVVLVSDTMTPRDEAVHQYDALFHLDSGSAMVNEATKAVRTNNPDAANVAIVPWAEGGVSVQIVQGKEEEPVQGWARGQSEAATGSSAGARRTTRSRSGPSIERWTSG